MNDQESWDNWRKHVLSEIKRINENAHTIQEGVLGLKIEIAKLEVKAGVWGLLGGIIPVVVLIAMERFK